MRKSGGNGRRSAPEKMFLIKIDFCQPLLFLSPDRWVMIMTFINIILFRGMRSENIRLEGDAVNSGDVMRGLKNGVRFSSEFECWDSYSMWNFMNRALQNKKWKNYSSTHLIFASIFIALVLPFIDISDIKLSRR